MGDEDLVLDRSLLEHPVLDDRPISVRELRESLRASLQFLFNQHRDAPLDVVYAQYLSFGSYAAAAFSRSTGVPVVISCFGRDLTIGFPKLPCVKRMGTSAARRASAIIVPNSEVHHLLQQEIHFPSRSPRISVVPSPVDKIFAGAHARSTRHSVITSILTINSCFKPEKGLDTLLAAFNELSARHLDTTLYIAGTDDHPEQVHRSRLMSQIERLGLSHKVIFTGYLARHEVANYLRECDIFVDARHVSNFSSVMVEAQFTKTPTIASATHGAREVIDHGMNGLLFEPRNADALFRHLLYLVENPSERRRLSSACVSWLWTKGAAYQEAACFERFEQLFMAGTSRSSCA
jgi:glycosyltransferase involved in cell wall biosynthesis